MTYLKTTLSTAFLLPLFFTAAISALHGTANAQSVASLAAYADPAEPALPANDMVITMSDTAIVITDPQIDFLSPDGVAWGVVANALWTTEEVISRISAAM